MLSGDLRTTKGPERTLRALARCLADPEVIGEAWGRRPVLSRREELPGAFADLIDLRAVDEILSGRGLRTPFVRVVRDGDVIDVSRWTRGGGVGAEIGDQVDEAAVARLFADGATVVLQGLHRTWPPIAEFVAELSLELGHPIQANAYITPAASQGFAAHYDIHDVFVLQFAGEKRWIVHEPVLDIPLRSQPWTQRRADVLAAAEGEPALDVVLREGDALYLPRGWIHSAEAEQQTSGHLTVGIHVATRQALAQALLDTAVDDPELRTALEPGVDLTDHEALADDLDSIVLALQRAVFEQPDRVVAALRARIWQASAPGALAPLAQAAATATPELAVRLRPGLRAVLRSGTLVLPGRSLAVPPGTEDAVHTLLDRDAHLVGELPGDAANVLELVGIMLRDGLVVPAA